MSEYQYYEFRAIDRPLSKHELTELGALSSRAQITPVSFVNTYNWGNFKGDPLKLMERYFDAFVYVANWGTRQLMLRLPSRLCDLKAMRPYVCGDAVTVTQKDQNIILQFLSADEPEDWEAGEGWMASLMPLRTELMQGDLRCFYLSWLLAAQAGELADEEEEPAVPSGLRSLSAALQSFAGFMRIDLDLVEAAAVASGEPPVNDPSKEDLQAWIFTLSESERDAALLKLLEQGDSLVRLELLKRFRVDVSHQQGIKPQEKKCRTVAELLAAAENITAEKERREAERHAAEEARQKKEQAAARARHLKQLEGRESELWQRAGDLVQTSKPKDYDQAITLLADLRDLAVQAGQTNEFKFKLSQLRQRYSSRPSFQKRLIKAGF
jgi:antitoxin component of MazEF toxin-antitoxin module